MSTKTEKIILVPIDATEQTTIALNQSYNLARLTGSKIVLLSVDEDGASFNLSRFDSLSKDASEKSGQPIETIIKKGNVYAEINNVADKLKPMFVMIGLSSKISLGKITGQNAFKMVRESKHPVITIRGQEHRDGCKRILLPLDLTRETREKVSNAVTLAKLFNAEIQIISILTQNNKIDKNKLIAYSNQTLKFIKEHGVRCTAKTLKGKDITAMILSYGKEVEADLILIMSKAELDVKEFFIGTVAQRLINESEIPVLSYRPKKRKDTSVFTK